ncbi:MAG TPA: TolC family protein [Phycisphaerae bacterium]|nr:TolC family protein [Phycisphaerae bacterium]
MALKECRRRGAPSVAIGCLSAWTAVCLGLTGCQTKLDSIETVLRRQSAALARLPEEDRGWKHHYEADLAAEAADAAPWPGLLTLEQARAIALRANPDIHAARARIDQALARIGEARASYFPAVTLGHSSTQTFQTPSSQNRFDIPSTQTPFTGLTDLQNFDLSTLLQVLSSPLFGAQSYGSVGESFSEHSSTLSTTWTLFDGFSREASVLAAKYAHRAFQMSLADAQRLLSQAVEAAYYQAQLGREQLRIARADEGFSEEQLEVAQKRLEAGKASQADVLNFEVRLRAAQANVVASIGLLNSARTVLAELMGIDDARLPEHTELSPLAEESAEELTSPDADEWVERALASRPDLSQKEYELKAKTEEVQAAKGQFSPSLSLSGSYGFDRLSNMRYRKNDQASAGALEFRWQLFTGGFRTSRVRFVEAKRWESAAQLRRLRQKVASDVRQAAIALIDTQEQVRLQRLNLVSATENRRIVKAEYGAGKASLVRLNQAQRDLVETDAALAQARIRLRQAWSDLRAAASAYPTPG